jgi:hypothetical protein
MRAHFFHVENPTEKCIAFHCEEGKIVRMRSASAFELVGSRITHLANEELPVFFGQFPSLRLSQGIDKEDIAKVSVWRSGAAELACLLGEDGTLCPAAVLSGQYRIGLTGEDQSFPSGTDIVFLAELGEFSVSWDGVFPPALGYPDSTILARLGQDASLGLAGSVPGSTVKCVGAEIEVVVPASPNANQIPLRFSSRSFSVKFAIEIPRLWWAIVDSNQPAEATEWSDQSIIVHHRDFHPTSKRELRLQLPAKYRPLIEGVGFDIDGLRSLLRTGEAGCYCVPLNSYYDDRRLSDTAAARELRLYAWHEDNPVQVALATVETTYRCALCSSIVEEWDLKNHVAKHALEAVPEVKYEEIRDRFLQDLPRTILKCAYCGEFYVPVPEGTNPDGAMKEHIEKDCIKANVSFGPRNNSYHVVTDASEVRAHLYAHLPVLRRCSFCDKEFQDAEEGRIVEHIMTSHLKQIMIPE